MVKPKQGALAAWVALCAGLALSCAPNANPTGQSASLGGNDGGICSNPVAGCACAPGALPVDCALDPVLEGNILVCNNGTAYCRGGAWSSCENIRQYRIQAPPAALITPPSQWSCNPCNPDCNLSTVRPEASDLTAQNSSSVTYNPALGGITLLGNPAAVLTDTDGDGVPDVADACVGPGFRTPCSGSAVNDGLYHTIPTSGSAYDPLSIDIKLKNADIYILMDATASMQDEISNLQSSLTTGTFDSSCTAGVNGGLLGAMRCAIPNANFGVGLTREYPRSDTGETDELPYHHLLDITSDLTRAQRAVNALNINGNNDWPEEQAQALYSVASGSGVGRWVPNRTGCPSGYFGYPCFRAGAIPIIILFTDAPFHNGPTGHNLSTGGSYNYTTAATSLPMVNNIGSSGQTLTNEAQASAMALGDLTTTSRSVMASTIGMTNDVQNGCGSSGGRDAVFSFTLTATTTVTIDTFMSDYDTLLSLRDSSFAELNCNDDYGSQTDNNGSQIMGLTSYISRSLNAGTYYVVVDGYSSGSQGAFRLNIRTTGTGGMGTTTASPVSWSTTQSSLVNGKFKVISVLSCASCDSQSTALSTCNTQRNTATASCDATYSSCTNTCTNTYNTCNTCVNGCNSAYTTCSNCSANCTTTYNSCTSCVYACASNDKDCRRRCNNLPTGGSGSYTQTTALSDCLATKNACVTACPTSTTCTNNKNTCLATCTATSTTGCTNNKSSCNTTCTNNKNTCYSAAPSCSTQQTAYNNCVSANSGDTSYSDCADTYTDARTMGTATGSVDANGTPFVYGIATNGSGLQTTLVDAVRTVATYSRYDISLVAEDVTPSNGVDERLLVSSIGPTPTCPATCTGQSGSTCLGCLPTGGNVPFTVNFSVPNVAPFVPTTMPLVFELAIVAYGGGVELSRTPVRIVVPLGTATYPSTGTFTQIYRASDRCLIPPQRPNWQTLTYDVSTPVGTQITFAIRTAGTEAGLASATPVSFSLNSTTPVRTCTTLSGTVNNCVDVGALFVAGGQLNYQPFAQVTATLQSNATGTASPVLSGWNFQFACVDAE